MGLKKIKILNLSSLLPGPFASFLLSQNEMFEVTKVGDLKNADPLRQMWPTDGGISVSFKAINENKQSVDIDYKSDESIQKLKRLISENDVLIESFKTGRLDKLGFGYKDCLSLNPNIVYCSITGFGYKHKLSSKPAHDLNILGYSGLLTYNNQYKVPSFPFADIITSYEATNQILISLLCKRPQWLDISMLDSVTKATLLINSSESYLKRNLKPNEFILWGNFPCYSTYKTKDYKYMALAAIEPSFWSDYCNHLGITDLINAQFDDDPETKQKVADKVSLKTQKEWIEADIDCFTPIYSYMESKSLGYV